MDQQPPDPGFDVLRDLAAHVEELERELGACRFPVYGVVEPRLRDASVGQTGRSDGLLDEVQLTWGGHALAASAPSISVRTTMCDPDISSWPVEILAETLADERERREDAADADEPAPAYVEQRRSTLPVDGADTPADIRIEGESWAALLEVPYLPDQSSVQLQVLVSAFRVPLTDVRLGHIADLARTCRARAPSCPGRWRTPGRRRRARARRRTSSCRRPTDSRRTGLWSRPPSPARTRCTEPRSSTARHRANAGGGRTGSGTPANGRRPSAPRCSSPARTARRRPPPSPPWSTS